MAFIEGLLSDFGIRNDDVALVPTISNVLMTRGVYMKILLTFLLMTTQLLTGSGASVYLCIGCDGSYGIETSLESCMCDSEGEAAETNGDCECDDLLCEHRHAHSQPQLADDGVDVDVPCGCTHIPIVVSSNLESDFVRSLFSYDADDFSSLAVLPASELFQKAPIKRLESLWYAFRSDVPNLSLTVISTIVLRC